MFKWQSYDAVVIALAPLEVFFAQGMANLAVEARPNFQVDPLTITLIGGMVVTIIGTIVTGIISVITAMRVVTVKDSQTAATMQINSVAKDTEAIKGHVNSEKTAAEGREVTLRQEIALLREIISDKKATAGLLAQAVAAAGVTPTLVLSTTAQVAPGSVPADANTNLQNIDQQTKAIEENTKKTNQTVQELKEK